MTTTATYGRRFCVTCQDQVFELDHRRHDKILEAIIDAEVPGWDNLFVHCRGSEENFDEDGAVVTCDHCFIAELADGGLLTRQETIS